ncbi:RING finger protein [Blastomyces gilchristii SLH14081]|uniref:RING finger protein n=1 Tax=Blastomyces gilchristii (strain SLH14081) TaxID=559298 RepID=A0A179UX56_BLAGS|nr:RING finger protein [Blastomyces gilchristii SLH14081]OAT11698.1 RING finger protein [Blastomyces gilchristii SLH14081]
MVLSLALPSFYSRRPPQSKSTASRSTESGSIASSADEPLASESNLSSISKSIASPSTTPHEAPTQITASSSPPAAAAAGPSTIAEALRGNPFGIVSRTKVPSDVAASEKIKEEEERERERDRRELNDALATLTQLFPDVKIEVFRELLVRFDGKSRLHVCVEQLLRYRAEWVKGRWNVPEPDAKSDNGGVVGGPGRGAVAVDGDGHAQGRRGRWIPHEELFQSKEYKVAVKSTLSLEFRALSRSAIDAVLAEVNFSYTRARPTLRELSRKSWRATFGSIFPFKRKKDKDDHPLLVWQKLPDGELVPRLKETGCLELDRELHDAFLAPLLARRKEEQEAMGLKLAEELNQSEAEAAKALYECDCCLSDVTFEQISTCSTSSHIICFYCIQRTIHEALFGQGWAVSIDHERSTLRCLAPIAEGTCEGSLDPMIVKRAILIEKAGAETYQKFEDRLTSECLLKSQLKLIRCPLCSYAEVDPVYHPTAKGLSWRFRRGRLLPTILTTIFVLDLIPLLILPVLFSLLFYPSMISNILSASLRNVCLKTRPQRFTCSNPSCRSDSCITCHKPWQDPHHCHEPLLQSLRTTVEAARTAAIKRTCPRCGLSFVKSSGCNKLTCVCGYSMCYICRKALGPPHRAAGANNILALRQPQQRARPPNRRPRHDLSQNNIENAPTGDYDLDGNLIMNIPEDDDYYSDDGTNNTYNNNNATPAEDEEPEGYKHFCEHFRANPGSRCTECNKCDLYLAEDEEAVARRAGERAECQWRIRQGLLNSSSSSSPGATLPSDALAKLYDMPTGGDKGMRHYGGYRGPAAGPWDWNWQLDGTDWRRRWRFWGREIWRDGRWKGEGQRLVDTLVEKIVVVDF